MQINRRSLIIGAPVAAAAVTVPLAAFALSPSSRMAALYVEWERADGVIRSIPEDTPYAAWKPLADAARAARRAIVQEPARTFDDLYLKLVAAATSGGGVEGIKEGITDDLSAGDAFDSTLAMSALLDMVRGVDGLPRVVPVTER
ncbi:hypothetical protein ACTZWW_04105 [Salinarimonas sp. NSM]|uniref:hypothetical protein n=1 Tax=Salinarimonas sp. NSM TaxID=3458003 RepID=UPI004035D6CB